MPPTQADASSFVQYSEAVFTTGTVEGASNMILSQHAATTGAVRPLCGICGQSFGRPQDLKRHIKDKHMPRRQCPFCSHEWSRPDRIKAHLTDAHRDALSAEVLQGICALRGQAVVDFLETYEILRSVLPQIYSSSAPLLPS
ncbi:hypothetical protein EDB92DRAFT_1816023 [Lactarius akahatsu]|uniref:C2H2-type domain-containing protein n=1 Tax=Lactarius akahatsu TaxID=416441 RepID=A0AAD4LHL2_9AGAM|nr:hypothetical protein EDB92DRAFT_1816023 [Lactarius akahatsu]